MICLSVLSLVAFHVLFISSLHIYLFYPFDYHHLALEIFFFFDPYSGFFSMMPTSYP
jgi:hypothetical protein